MNITHWDATLQSSTEVINKAYGTHVKETLGGYYIILFVRLLASSHMHS
jgi:hypothetical protein